MNMHDHTNTIIIGAGAAGLACAVCLKKLGIPFLLLEKASAIGEVWRNRYSRLHLHTTKTNSRLPYFEMPADYPKYISKDEFAEYLESYAKEFDVRPCFNETVLQACKVDNGWQVRTGSQTFSGSHLIIATGLAAMSRSCKWEGIENFEGNVLHSAQYSNGKDFRNKRVLVVGFGNSACEIALCLNENGARAALSVRSCVNILPRDIAGISVVDIALLENRLTKLSSRIVDAINKPILSLINGSIKRYGLRKCEHGAMTQITRDKKIPLLDVGTMRLIRQREVLVYPGISEVGRNGVRFMDGREENFDAIISAIGYDPSFSQFMDNWEKLCDASGIPQRSGQESAVPGLFFCGFHVSPTGMLREIGIEARNIARLVAKKTYSC